MLRSALTTIIALVATLFVVGCSQSTSPAAPTSLSSALSSPLSAGGSSAPSMATTQSVRNEHACWGEATQVFAQTGELGEHASQQATPRLGLRNVARALYELGFIPDDSLQALGAFLSSALGLSIESCL